MIDPFVSLAFSIYSNPGVYALLLGSGVSRSAAIPTGWEVVLDLIRKVAVLEGADPEPDPEAWYKSGHQTQPSYSELLNLLARSPAERSQVLRPYFEPTDDERERGIKTPTVAHRAIAELMKGEYIRVVLTTNFDRLLETALADVGLQPTIISSADAIRGALPFAHARCLVVKINGDYLDTRIKNTIDELARYDAVLNGFLDRLFDEFGLIVCGWSGDWDIALRSAIERCPNRRFSTYWTAPGEPTAKAKDLIQHRKAILLPIENADRFFQTLKEKVLALAQFGSPHPLSAKIASTQVKQYITHSEDRILLHDLVSEETERAYAGMDPKRFLAEQVEDTATELSNRLKAYHSLVEIPLPIIIAGCHWGEEQQEYLWRRMLERFGDPPGSSSVTNDWVVFRLYPASLLMYAAGVAALAGRKLGNFVVALRTPIQ